MAFDYSFGFRLYFFVVVLGCIGCRAQDIGGDFNFKDNGLLYEVIFVGQEDVALICRTTGVENATITIRSPEGLDLIRSDGEGNCLEYAFSSVEAGDNGVYTCNIGYIDTLSGEEIFVTKSLEMNVINDEQACFRNGTAQSAYAIGDVLLFSCYCNNITNCMWIRSVPGGRLGETVPMQDISKVGRVTVVRAIIRPLNQPDLLWRYDCAHAETKDDRCSLGPADISASDTVRDISASSVVLPACSETAITLSPVMTLPSSPAMTSPNVGPIDNPIDGRDKDDPNDPDGNWIIYIIMAGVLLLLLFLLVVLTLLAIKVKRNKKSKTEEVPRSQNINPNQDPSETNVGYVYGSEDYGIVDKKRGVDGGGPSVGPVHYRNSYNDSDGNRLPDLVIPFQNRSFNDDDDHQFVQGRTTTATTPQSSMIAELSQRGALMADRIRNADQLRQSGDMGHHGAPSRVPEMSRYDASADEVNDAEEFVNVDVTEYRVPLAFTSNADDGVGIGLSNTHGTTRYVPTAGY